MDAVNALIVSAGLLEEYEGAHLRWSGLGVLYDGFGGDGF